ncbi:hypothetical protein AB0B50_40160 [Streptomyces sp. NPDC041068]|uniref:hypothetical protein n=1 Tax=Streptomyces sp. NPDC041068 TaxID=3155130 RepID=UPI0033FCE3E6
MNLAEYADSLADAIELNTMQLRQLHRERARALADGAPVAAAEYAERIEDLAADHHYLRRKLDELRRYT